MSIITIVNQNYTDNYTISLTNQKLVWAQRKFRTPKSALTYVCQLQTLGHKISSFSKERMIELLKKTEAVVNH